MPATSHVLLPYKGAPDGHVSPVDVEIGKGKPLATPLASKRAGGTVNSVLYGNIPISFNTPTNPPRVPSRSINRSMSCI